MKHREHVALIMQALNDGDAKKIDKIVDDKFVSHNLYSLPTKAGMMNYLAMVKKTHDERAKAKQPQMVIKTIHTVEDGDMVAVLVHVSHFFDFKHYVGIDIFRFENGKLVEYWDAMSEEVKDETKSIVNLKVSAAKDLDKKEANKKMVRELLEKVINKNDVKQMPKYFAETFIEHNPYIPMPLDRFMQGYEKMVSAGRGIQVKKVHMLFAEGNYVVAATEGSVDHKMPISHFDIFKIENGKIIEWWDVLEPLPSGPHVINKVGKW